MTSLWDDLSHHLQQRESLHLKRVRHVVDSAQGPEITINGKRCLCFCSNDYLGLANHPVMIGAINAATEKYGVGGGASHLVCGHSTEHHELENEFAAMTGRDRALVFSTGYMANQAVITTLLGKDDAIFEDKWNHASLLDAGLASGARFQRYLHNDMDNLRLKMDKNTKARRKLVCVDGVFSMDGDLATLPELVEITQANDSLLMVDDAHGFGVLGESGLGCCEHFNLDQNDVPILMCTLGKAMGSFGAIVAGPDILIETLVQMARPYIYTTSLPPAVAAATRVALRLMQVESWRREQLQLLIQHFTREAQNIGLPIMPSSTPVQPVLIGDEQTALLWQESLFDAGFYVTAIRPPTVPEGTARLRITFSASHTVDDVDKLLEAMGTVSRKLPVRGDA